MSTLVTPCLPETGPDHPKGSRKEENRMSKSNPPAGAGASLADLERALQKNELLSATRRRDLRSAVARVAALLGDEPGHLPLDLAIIAAKLTAINPVASGLTPKTLSNIRSDLLAAVRASGLQPVLASSKAGLSPRWADLLAKLSGKRARIGLSRLARYASAVGLAPGEINDAAIERFIGDVRKGSLHHNPNALHRKTAIIWTEVAGTRPELGLHPVAKPSFRGPPKRIAWAMLTDAFRADVEKYLVWCESADIFAADARPRSLAPRTLKLRRNQIHAAITALIESGRNAGSIKSVADLVSVDAFKFIMRRRHEAAGSKTNSFNRDLAELLVQIAREWVRVDAQQLTELKRLAGKVPMPASGLTDKNKRSMRQFDDPAARYRLKKLPAQLWSEVKRDQAPNFRTLAKAQAALAIAILNYIPLRSQNLHALEFDVHVFLHDDIRATSSLEIPSEEVKNKTELAFDIPQPIARMLIEYRDRIAPKVIGHRPKRLFVKFDGSPKSQAMVALLIKSYLRKRAGIELTSHQFRHLSAKTILDTEQGNYETASHLLGHKDPKTTFRFYSGNDSRRAGRHHQHLVDKALEEQVPRLRRGSRKKG
jgi:integrase